MTGNRSCIGLQCGYLYTQIITISVALRFPSHVMEMCRSVYHTKMFPSLQCERRRACGQGWWRTGAPGAGLVGRTQSPPRPGPDEGFSQRSGWANTALSSGWNQESRSCQHVCSKNAS